MCTHVIILLIDCPCEGQGVIYFLINICVRLQQAPYLPCFYTTYKAFNEFGNLKEKR